MNLKSFPGPQPYIRVGGVEMVGETRDGVGGRIAGDGGLRPDFWGAPTCQCWGGDPCHRGSQAWCSRRSNGGRVPQLPANPSPPPVALSLGRRGADGGVCAGGTVSAPLPKLL